MADTLKPPGGLAGEDAGLSSDRQSVADWEKFWARDGLSKAAGDALYSVMPEIRYTKGEQDKMARIWAMDPDSREAYFKKAPGDRRLFEADRQLMLTQTFPGEMSYEEPGHDFSQDMSMETPSGTLSQQRFGRTRRRHRGEFLGQYNLPDKYGQWDREYPSSRERARGLDLYGPPEDWQSKELALSGPMSMMPTEQIHALMQQTGLSEEDAKEALAVLGTPTMPDKGGEADDTDEPLGMDFTNFTEEQWSGLANAFQLHLPGRDDWTSTKAATSLANLASRGIELGTLKGEYVEIAKNLFGDKDVEDQTSPEFLGVLGQLEKAKADKNELDADVAMYETEKARLDQSTSAAISAMINNLHKDYMGPGGRFEKAEAFLDSALDEIQDTGQSFWQQFDPFPEGWEGGADWGNIGRVGLALTSLATLIGGTALNIISEGKIPNFGMPLFQLALDKASEGMMTGYRKADAANTILGRMESILGSKRAAIASMETAAYARAAKHFEYLSKQHAGTDKVRSNAYKIASLEFKQKGLEKKESMKRSVMDIVMTQAELDAKTSDAMQSYYTRMTAADVQKFQSLLALKASIENSRTPGAKPEFDEKVVEARTKVLIATQKFKSTMEQLVNITQDKPGNLEQFLTIKVSKITDHFDQDSDEYKIWKSLHMQSQIIGQYMARGFDTGNLSEWEQKFWREIVNPTNPGSFSVKNLISHLYIFEQDRRGQVHRMWSYMNNADKARFKLGIQEAMGGGEFLDDHEKWKQSVLSLRHGAKGAAGTGVTYTGARPALFGTEAWDMLGFDTNLFDGITPEEAWREELKNVIYKGEEPGYYRAPKGRAAGLNSLRVQANSRKNWAKTNKLVATPTRIPGVMAYLPREVHDQFLKFQEAAKAAGHVMQLDGKLAGGRSGDDYKELLGRWKAGEEGIFEPSERGSHTKHGGFRGIDISVGMPSPNSKKTPLFLWARDNAKRFGFQYKAHNHHFDFVGLPKKKKKSKKKGL